MAVTGVAQPMPTQVRAPGEATRARRTVTPAAVLAGFGALIVAYETWTWGAWLRAGPTQITEYRDRSSASWAVARGYEALILVVAALLLVRVVRRCRAEHRLVFDAKLLIAGVAALFWDPFGNFVQPAFFYSSNWLNVNSWTGFAPLVVNPDAGRLPEPLFICLVYPFGLLGFAMIMNAVMGAFRRRRPATSDLAVLAVGSLAGYLLGMALEAPMFLLHLWSLPGAPAALSLFGDNHRFAAVEYLTTAFVFAGWGAVRWFRDDRGRALTERGFDDLPAGRRTTAGVLATVGWCCSLLLVLQLVVNLFAFRADPYPAGFPRHLVNGMCDVGATSGTRYGPCPGSDHFRLPTPGSLPGPAPFR
jgi:hypothetical protein